jgi:hypothetical protein
MVKLSWIRNYWFWKNEIITHNKETNMMSDDPMGWNIYTPQNTKRKDFSEKFYKVHGRFKYRFLVPILIIARKFFLPKYKHEGVVEKNDYNLEWVIFERSYNLAMEDMETMFYYKNNKKNKISKKEARDKVRNDPACEEYLKILKQGIIYVSSMDSAYHEFGAFLMHRISQEMTKELNGRTYNRVIYDSNNVSDIHWYIIQKQLNNTNNKLEVEVKEVSEGTEYEW